MKASCVLREHQLQIPCPDHSLNCNVDLGWVVGFIILFPYASSSHSYCQLSASLEEIPFSSQLSSLSKIEDSSQTVCKEIMSFLKNSAALHYTYPGVANCDLAEATAISQLATSWHPAAVASPVCN